MLYIVFSGSNWMIESAYVFVIADMGTVSRCSFDWGGVYIVFAFWVLVRE